MLSVVEVFYSLQGEGKYIGTPSVFIRLGGCNLRCFGFGCDSMHAVDKKNFSNKWLKIRNYDDFINLIPNKDCDIVITGGEPTLHYNNPILYKAVKKWINQKRRVTFETNGTIALDFNKFKAYKDVVFSLSVKLSNSGETKAKRINHKALKNFSKNCKNLFFKFVVSKNDIKKSSNEILKITKKYNIPIYCMPLGESSEKLKENAKDVFELCMKNRWNYSDRIHIRVYGSKGGH